MTEWGILLCWLGVVLIPPKNRGEQLAFFAIVDLAWGLYALLQEEYALSIVFFVCFWTYLRHLKYHKILI